MEIGKTLGVFIMKIYYKDKIKILELIEQGLSESEIAKMFNISSTWVNKIGLRYKNIDNLTSLVNKHDRVFSPEFKLQIIQLAKKSENISALARQYNIDSGTLFNWMKKYDEMGYNGLRNKKGRPPKNMNDKITVTKDTNDEKDKIIREQQERIKQLEMENDLLKKLHALVQKRKQHPTKKRP